MSVAHVRSSRQGDRYALGDGSRVYHAEDLLAVVPPDSPTAWAAERSRHARKVSYGWLGSVIAGSLVGIGFVYAGFASDDWDPAEDGLPSCERRPLSVQSGSGGESNKASSAASGS